MGSPVSSSYLLEGNSTLGVHSRGLSQGPGKVVHESAREYCGSVLHPAVTFANFEQAVMMVTSIARAGRAAARGPVPGAVPQLSAGG